MDLFTINTIVGGSFVKDFGKNATRDYARMRNSLQR